VKTFRKQRQSILYSNAKLNFWSGPVRSGKTVATIVRFIKYIAVDAPPVGEFYMIGKTHGALRRNVITPMEDMLGKEMRLATNSMGEKIIRLWGRVINVLGAKDIGSIAKIQGSTSAGGLGDEVSLWPADFFRMMTSRMSIPGSKFYGTTNPDSPHHWLKTGYLDRADEVNAKVFTWGLRENEFLEEEYLAQVEAEYTGLWRKRYIDGLWVLAEGAIYDMYDEDVHLVEKAPAKPDEYIIGVDYATGNPTVFLLIGIHYPPNSRPIAWCENEYYYDSKVSLRQKTDVQYAEDLERFMDTREFMDVPINKIYVDPSASSFKVQCTQGGIWQIADADNDVLNGIRSVSTMLHQRRWRIHSRCGNLRREKVSYVWDPKKGLKGIDAPVKADDHCSDAERYALHTHLGQDTVLYNAQSMRS
jgi:PBSX family phage terminase large subunit